MRNASKGNLISFWSQARVSILLSNQRIQNVVSFLIAGGVNRFVSSSAYVLTSNPAQQGLVYPYNYWINKVAQSRMASVIVPAPTALYSKVVAFWTLDDNATIPDLYLAKGMTSTGDDFYQLLSSYTDLQDNLPNVTQKVAEQYFKLTNVTIVFKNVTQKADHCHHPTVPLRYAINNDTKPESGRENSNWAPTVLGVRHVRVPPNTGGSDGYGGYGGSDGYGGSNTSN